MDICINGGDVGFVIDCLLGMFLCICALKWVNSNKISSNNTREEIRKRYR